MIIPIRVKKVEVYGRIWTAGQSLRRRIKGKRAFISDYCTEFGRRKWLYDRSAEKVWRTSPNQKSESER